MIPRAACQHQALAFAHGLARARVGDRQERRGRREESKRERRRFDAVHKAEAQYGRALSSLARQIGQFARGFDTRDPASMSIFENMLTKYSEAIRPWATATASRMIADVSRRDAAVWNDFSADMSKALRMELEQAPTGEYLRKKLDENVRLITSLPLGAAQRVHKLVVEGMGDATRAGEIAEEIMRTGHVTRSRAMLIARTEVARVASGLVEARSLHVGSEGYIWRTAEDSDVRPALSLPAKVRAGFIGSHRKLNGKFIRWDSPPVSGSRGERAHAGQIYNCRCYPEPVLPDTL